MARRVAFLRAINVGGRRVKMDRLREVFEELGFENVSTHIASGNVIFDAAGRASELERRIESTLHEELGFEVMTFVRTPRQIAGIVERKPFPKGPRDGETHMVAFLRRRPSAAARRAAEALSGDRDVIVLEGSEAHWLIRGKMMDSALKPKALERALDGDPGTTRNITMLRGLHAKLAG